MAPITKKDLSRLYNYRLILVHEKIVQKLRFYNDGQVTVSRGTKEGPITRKTYYWSVTEKGVLRITSTLMNAPWMNAKPIAEWTDIKFDEDIMTVETKTGKKIYIMEMLPRKAD